MIKDLSEPEFSVLSVLWKQQPLSVREVHDQLEKEWAYTTTKTVMDRMAAKDLLERDVTDGVIVYSAKIGRAEGLGHWVRFFADKIFGIEPDEVLNLFVKNKTYSRQEIDTIRKLIRQSASGGNKTTKKETTKKETTKK